MFTLFQIFTLKLITDYYYSLINLLNFCHFNNCIEGIVSKNFTFLGSWCEMNIKSFNVTVVNRFCNSVLIRFIFENIDKELNDTSEELLKYLSNALEKLMKTRRLEQAKFMLIMMKSALNMN